MDPNDLELQRWAKQWQDEHNEVVSHELFGRLKPGSDVPMEGWGGIHLLASNDRTGSREVDIEFRPVLLGNVEFRIQVATKACGASKPHTKRVFVRARAAALRELAAMLVETAELAERNRPKPRPVE